MYLLFLLRVYVELAFGVRCALDLNDFSVYNRKAFGLTPGAGGPGLLAGGGASFISWPMFYSFTDTFPPIELISR